MTTKDKDEFGTAIPETPHRSSSATPRSAASTTEPDRADRKTVACNVPFCPICTVLSTAQHLQPEILGHLLAAVREVSMAVRAAVDQRGDEVAPKQQGLQHIDLA
ncbi:MAG: hypothetical protein ACJ76P_06325 [Actinomycetota bacterium]|jgi:hypothetical protein